MGQEISMKQLYQIPRSGALKVEEVPLPSVPPGFVLVLNAASVISAGTERTAVQFAQSGLLDKARSRPDLVGQLMQKARREGILTAATAALSKLDAPQSLGYSCAGTVMAVGAGVSEFRVGDRVACAGADYAVHAEAVAVPVNLVAKIPSDSISFEDAAFATVGAIAMHGFRLGEPRLGEAVAVIGLGLIGLITVQIAKAAGCVVVGMDPDGSRGALAQQFGCDATATDDAQFASAVATLSSGIGADCVLITAGTSSNGPVELAAEVARGKARVVSVGAVGMTLPRKAYFQKELEFLVSRSYGPGRYDPNYESKGHDYPAEFVRWTENRNMQSFLALLAAGKLNVQAVITHRFSIDDAIKAYDLIAGESKEPYLGVLIRYPESVEQARSVELNAAKDREKVAGKVGLGVMGSGNFAVGVLIPAFQQAADVALLGLYSGRGVQGKHFGEKFGFQYATNQWSQLLEDASVHAMVIATRHSSHAQQVIATLHAGKHVFCEKPLCIDEASLATIVEEYRRSAEQGRAQIVMVGFNRRFSPMGQSLREFVKKIEEPLMIHYRVNGGQIPLDSWIQDAEIGGGRIIGEGCHFVDMCQFLAGSPCVRVFAAATPNMGKYADDNVAMTLEFANGSVANIVYTASGDKAMSKERIEVFGGGHSAVLDDFRTLEMWSDGRRKIEKSHLRQDKGHRAECEAFVRAIKDGAGSPIAFESLVNTTLTTLRLAQSVRERRALDVSWSAESVGEASELNSVLREAQ
jgi:predicted dehydrogenase/threonine dehydrogenase-like Zn-dependent dehydrogenase